MRLIPPFHGCASTSSKASSNPFVFFPKCSAFASAFINCASTLLIAGMCCSFSDIFCRQHSSNLHVIKMVDGNALLCLHVFLCTFVSAITGDTVFLPPKSTFSNMQESSSHTPKNVNVPLQMMMLYFIQITHWSFLPSWSMQARVGRFLPKVGSTQVN